MASPVVQAHANAHTLLHLVPDNSFAYDALNHRDNRRFVSTACDGNAGLEVGYHVPSIPGAHIITSLGRKGNLILPESPRGNPMSGIHVAFEFNPATKLIVLSVRSKRPSSVDFQPQRKENNDSPETIIGDGSYSMDKAM